MRPDLARIYKRTRELHTQLATIMPVLERDVREGTDEREQADVSYALREIAAFADEVRKMSNRVKETAEKMACMLTIAIKQSAEPIRTEYCTATPKVKTIVSIPSRSSDPDGYAALMTHLGVPDRLWRPGEHAAVKPHWPGLIDLLGGMLERGEPMPPGVDPNKTFPEYSLTCRGKKLPSELLSDESQSMADGQDETLPQHVAGEEIPF